MSLVCKQEQALLRDTSKAQPHCTFSLFQSFCQANYIWLFFAMTEKDLNLSAFFSDLKRFEKNEEFEKALKTANRSM